MKATVKQAETKHFGPAPHVSRLLCDVLLVATTAAAAAATAVNIVGLIRLFIIGDVKWAPSLISN